MMRGLARFAAMGMLAGLWMAAAAADTLNAGVAAAPVLDDRYPRVAVPFGTNVESFRDLVYSTPPGFRPLRLDLYKLKQPASSSGPAGHPLVIYIHGGGWQSGHTRHSGAFENWPAVLASLAAKGYVVASIEYRLSGEAKFPAAIQDVKTAIRWLRSKAGEFGIDRTRTVLWGGSAGGQLAALAATSCGVQALEPTLVNSDPALSALKAESDCVQGLVAWYGIFDIATTPEFANAGTGSPAAAGAGGKYLGCVPSQCGSVVGLASAVTHLDASDPPALLIHGELDKVVPVGQSRAFHAALQSKKVAAELMVIPGVDHSFIAASADATQKASLAALTKTFAFIDATVGGKRP